MEMEALLVGDTADGKSAVSREERWGGFCIYCCYYILL